MLVSEMNLLKLDTVNNRVQKQINIPLVYEPAPILFHAPYLLLGSRQVQPNFYSQKAKVRRGIPIRICIPCI